MRLNIMVNETGLQLLIVMLFPAVLGTGTISDVFHLSGVLPVVRQLLNKTVNWLMKLPLSVKALRTLLSIPSMPGDFLLGYVSIAILVSEGSIGSTISVIFGVLVWGTTVSFWYNDS
jgi:hypothetical protein